MSVNPTLGTRTTSGARNNIGFHVSAQIPNNYISGSGITITVTVNHSNTGAHNKTLRLSAYKNNSDGIAGDLVINETKALTGGTGNVETLTWSSSSASIVPGGFLDLWFYSSIDAGGYTTLIYSIEVSCSVVE